MSKGVLLVLLVFLGVTCLGCTKREYTGPQRFAISGKVTADGQLIQMGVIAFVPEDKTGRVSGGPIKEGAYAVDEPMGPTAGKYRVQIHWNKPTGKKIKNPMDPDNLIDQMMEGLPDKYHAKSELTADVSAQQTTFDFDLKAK
jgi:hypothetical protein